MPRHGPAIAETRRTDWIAVADRPEWQDSKVAAYRIWVMFDGLMWWQRHEWKMRDGSIDLNDWIRTTADFPPKSERVATDEIAA